MMDLFARQAVILESWNTACLTGDSEGKAKSEYALELLLQDMKKISAGKNEAVAASEGTQVVALSDDAPEDAGHRMSEAKEKTQELLDMTKMTKGKVEKAANASQIVPLADDVREYAGFKISNGDIRLRIWAEFLSTTSADIDVIRKKLMMDNDSFKQGNNGKAISTAVLLQLAGITPEIREFVLAWENQVKGMSKSGGMEKSKHFVLAHPLFHAVKGKIIDLFGFLETKFDKLFKKARIPGIGGRDTYPMNDKSALESTPPPPPFLPRATFLVYGNENKVNTACAHAGLRNGLRLQKTNGRFFGYFFCDVQLAEREVLRKIEESGEVGRLVFGHMV